MPWRKLGLVYAPAGDHEWNQSHAQVPTVDAGDEHRWRIYFATRDGRNRSHTSYVEVEAGNPTRVLYVHDRPILALGRLGAFDDCGVMPSWILEHEGKKHLYYIGWTVRNTIPYHNAIGLAISDDNGATFSRPFEGPLFSPTPTEPYFTGTSCVLIEDGVWKNWYLSCTKWEEIDGRPEPFYHIKYAESEDGIHWRREGLVAIDYASADEGGIVRASVTREDGGYTMWYSYRKASRYREDRSRSYRIGRARSTDGRNWRREDERAGIDVSEDGWDAQMLAYPQVVKHASGTYLFYNGNGFGRSGFGCAVWT
ncbi:MAG: hypothetical protein ACE5FA_12190 [Dehalococcoidia bacterium]